MCVCVCVCMCVCVCVCVRVYVDMHMHMHMPTCLDDVREGYEEQAELAQRRPQCVAHLGRRLCERVGRIEERAAQVGAAARQGEG